MIQLFNGDCLEAMKNMKDNEFDLSIVDPPYMDDNSGLHAGKRRTILDISTFKKPKKEYFNELFRVSKNQIIWGGNYFTDILPSSRGWICWDKIKSAPIFSDFELAWTSFDRVCNLFRFCNNGGFVASALNQKIHPTQKPVELYIWLLSKYAQEGDKILDTHLGSGSIAIACHNLGYDLVGCELNDDYFQAAKKRLEEHQKQLRLF
jgi:site-specific DNA-methyltransferase (adenine-specific)